MNALCVRICRAHRTECRGTETNLTVLLDLHATCPRILLLVLKEAVPRHATASLFHWLSSVGGIWALMMYTQVDHTKVDAVSGGVCLQERPSRKARIKSQHKQQSLQIQQHLQLRKRLLSTQMQAPPLRFPSTSLHPGWLTSLPSKVSCMSTSGSTMRCASKTLSYFQYWVSPAAQAMLLALALAAGLFGYALSFSECVE